MSEYEKLNTRIKTQIADRRKEIIKEMIKGTNILLVKVLVAITIFVCLKDITFISVVFMVLLIAATICIGAFKAGSIWSGFTR